jgi:hypothetical protein
LSEESVSIPVVHSAWDQLVAAARIARLEATLLQSAEKLTEVSRALAAAVAEKELLEQERDAALYEIDRLTGR